jgi:deazaflavin-dependent oxidoreductase (nitroreductase family)
VAPILIVVGVLLLVVVIVVIVFMIGMRRKTPWVLNAVRRFARGMGNPYQMRSAGKPGSYASVIRHTGRVSGRAYETPVAARVTEDGFVIATVYGRNTDWLKNVLANGSAAIVHEGGTFEVDRPELVPTDAVETYFGDKELRNLRRYRVTRCVRVRNAEAPREGATLAAASTSLRE